MTPTSCAVILYGIGTAAETIGFFNLLLAYRRYRGKASDIAREKRGTFYNDMERMMEYFGEVHDRIDRLAAAEGVVVGWQLGLIPVGIVFGYAGCFVSLAA